MNEIMREVAYLGGQPFPVLVAAFGSVASIGAALGVGIAVITDGIPARWILYAMAPGVFAQIVGVTLWNLGP